MPTEPHNGLLNRDWVAAASRAAVDIACPMLQELVNYASNVLVRCSISAKGGLDEDVAVSSIFRTGLTRADGIEVLLANGCTEPASVLIRGIFEQLISIEYIVRKDDEYVRRSLAWSGFRLSERIRNLKRFLPDTDSGRRLALEIERDEVARDARLYEALGDVRLEIAQYESVLSKPHFCEVAALLNNGRPPRGTRYRHWFQLFGGPENLADLARSVGRGALYDVLYTGWSRHTHGSEKLSCRLVDGEVVFEPIRYPERIPEIASFTVTFVTWMMIAMLEKFRPEDSAWRSWYLQEMKPQLERLDKIA